MKCTHPEARGSRVCWRMSSYDEEQHTRSVSAVTQRVLVSRLKRPLRLRCWPPPPSPSTYPVSLYRLVPWCSERTPCRGAGMGQMSKEPSFLLLRAAGGVWPAQQSELDVRPSEASSSRLGRDSPSRRRRSERALTAVPPRNFIGEGEKRSDNRGYKTATHADARGLMKKPRPKMGLLLISGVVLHVAAHKKQRQPNLAAFAGSSRTLR
ncbi:hypothetical protein PHYPSEUDO_011088 [Phytophthora pseudosyringae]|uniref:Uncharacterized protein n=1 Tax=Phytophthora pseudosyringae TaxID=221518 RepID=A0A8T1WAA7_9STRA|nr:hypothetical protein PHYPSEUDO_011088 [Phytophthora pseudosyringae]